MKRREFLRLTTLSVAGGLIPSSNWLARRFHVAPFDVYLTFDDGPFPDKDFKSGPTDNALQILKDHGVVATFFLHGRHILNWHGPVMVRYITDGHAIGNHLWSQGGNLVELKPGYVRLAYQFLLTEARIREVLQAADADAYQRYLQQSRLFRRPGGKNSLNDFLDPTNEHNILYAPVIRPIRDDVDWLKGVYDYSGWHINGGESIPLSVRPTTPEGRLKFILNGANGFYGIMNYLQAGTPPHYSVEATQGLIVLMHDFDADTRAILPQLITQLQSLGAQFHHLPRPIDKPNSTTVGIDHAPTVS
ncbi:MAG: polysaccharide deacetylase family protein [Chloroflexota bacterium]